MAVSQTISNISTLAEAPNPLVDTQEVFDNKAYPFTISQVTVNSEMQTAISQMNTAFEQINTTEANINAKEASAVSAAIQAESARDEAVGAVASLAEGVINNNTISETDTWSSEKIKNELDKKANTENTVTLAQLQAIALSL